VRPQILERLSAFAADRGRAYRAWCGAGRPCAGAMPTRK